MLPGFLGARVRRMLRPLGKACRGLAHPIQSLAPDVICRQVHICSACQQRVTCPRTPATSAKWAYASPGASLRLGTVNSLLLGPGHPYLATRAPGTGRGMGERS